MCKTRWLRRKVFLREGQRNAKIVRPRLFSGSEAASFNVTNRSQIKTPTSSFEDRQPDPSTTSPALDMGPSATNGDALAVLDEIKAPDGVVLPPKEIKGTTPQC